MPTRAQPTQKAFTLSRLPSISGTLSSLWPTRQKKPRQPVAISYGSPEFKELLRQEEEMTQKMGRGIRRSVAFSFGASIFLLASALFRVEVTNLHIGLVTATAAAAMWSAFIPLRRIGRLNQEIQAIMEERTTRSPRTYLALKKESRLPAGDTFAYAFREDACPQLSSRINSPRPGG